MPKIYDRRINSARHWIPIQIRNYSHHTLIASLYIYSVAENPPLVVKGLSETRLFESRWEIGTLPEYIGWDDVIRILKHGWLINTYISWRPLTNILPSCWLILFTLIFTHPKTVCLKGNHYPPPPSHCYPSTSCTLAKAEFEPAASHYQTWTLTIAPPRFPPPNHSVLQSLLLIKLCIKRSLRFDKINGRSPIQ